MPRGRKPAPKAKALAGSAADASVTFHQALPQRDGVATAGHLAPETVASDGVATAGHPAPETVASPASYRACVEAGGRPTPVDSDDELAGGAPPETDIIESYAGPSEDPVAVRRNNPKSHSKKKAVACEDDIEASPDWIDMQLLATFGPAPGQEAVDFLAGSGIVNPRFVKDADVFIYHNMTTRADVEGWVNMGLDDGQWEAVKRQLETAIDAAIDSVYQDIFTIVDKVTTASESFKEWPVVASGTLPHGTTPDGGERVGFQIFAKDLTGKTLTFDIHVGTAVGDLRAMIHERTGTPLHEIRIIYSGKHWDNDRMAIKSIFGDLYKDRTVHVMCHLRGGMPPRGKRGADGEHRAMSGASKLDLENDLKEAIKGTQASIGIMDISDITAISVRVNEMLTYAEKKAPKGRPAITNQFTHFIERMDMEERKAVAAVIGAGHNGTALKMKNLSKLMFPNGVHTVSHLRTKLGFVEQVMTQVVDYIFVKQFANARGIIDWDAAKTAIDDMKLDLAKEEGKEAGIAEAESRHASEGPGDVRMG